MREGERREWEGGEGSQIPVYEENRQDDEDERRKGNDIYILLAQKSST